MNIFKQIGVLICLATAVIAQQASSPTIQKVSVQDSVVLAPVRGTIPISNVHCDSAGNIYAPIALSNTDVRIPTLYRISPDGQQALAFLQPGRGGLVLAAQGVSSDGEVVMLPQVGNASALLRYSSRGSLISSVHLQDLMYGHIAPFRGGRVLVTYRQKTHALTSIFDVQGHRVAKVEFPDDINIEHDIEGRDPRYVNPLHPQESNRAVDLGDVVASQDGNVYVLRYGNPAFVYGVGPDGKVLQRFEIVPPTAGMFPINLQVTESWIVLWFKDSERKESVVLFADKTSGKTLRLYDDSGIPGVFVCYESKTDTLRYLNWKDDEISILRAVPQRVAQ